MHPYEEQYLPLASIEMLPENVFKGSTTIAQLLHKLHATRRRSSAADPLNTLLRVFKGYSNLWGYRKQLWGCRKQFP